MTEPVDLTNCDREPIHIPGSIQRHGAMLVCDRTISKLFFASANLAGLIGYRGSLARGTEIETILGERAAHDLRNAAAKGQGTEMAGVVLGLKFDGVQDVFDARIHTYLDRSFIEIEPCRDAGRSAQQALDLTQALIRRIGLESDVEGIATAGARLVRGMLGYDRVMVYRFLHNGAGRVIAESKAPTLNSFLGQHFPAADIPYQARRLYLLNPIRMISDTSYVPIPLQPPLAGTEPPVDMSFAQLRSVSPIHCEYLRNMGVFASMSISIIVGDELWGLISCHHDSPKIIPMASRVAIELFGQYFSLQVSVAERRAEMLASTQAREKLDSIVSGLSAEGAVMHELGERLGEFSTLMHCDGVGLWADGTWRSVDSATDRETTRALVGLLADEAPGLVWKTQELRAHVSTGNSSSVAGVMAIPLSMLPGNYLMLFRNEEAHGIDWAGEPVKQVVSTPSGDRLTPRGSFELWREEVKGRSTPWTDADLSVAEAIRTYLRDVILRQTEVTAEERARTEQRRRILNDELNHRVKNIIALVKSIALQTGTQAVSVAEYSTALEGRLMALAFAHDQSLSGSGAGDLATLIEAEASLHRYGASAQRVTATGPGIRIDDRTFGVLALVVHEMMTNAAKYGALSAAEGRLDLAWELTPAGDCVLNWTESGGPEVTPPSRDGFGTKLIRSTMEYDLHGQVEMRYDAGGLKARFVIPADYVQLDTQRKRAPEPVESRTGSLAGLAVLVVEDQSLIAMDTEDTLRRLGAGDIRLSPSAADAEAKLGDFAPDVAVLDFNLGTGTSETVADLLTARGVPFVFATGYGDNVMIPPRFRGVPVVRKPISGAVLEAQLDHAKRALGEDGTAQP